MERVIKLYTSVGGYDLLQEALEREFGVKRYYFPNNKVLRILRKSIKIKKSAAGKYYKYERL